MAHRNRRDEYLQWLLEAERRGTELIDTARRNRLVRLKQANDEASKEIEKFNRKQEEIFNKLEEKVKLEDQKVKKKIKNITNEFVEQAQKELKADSNEKKEIVNLIIDRLVNVKLEQPKNYIHLQKLHGKRLSDLALY